MQWNLFDSIWCVHFIEYKNRLKEQLREFDRVGITNHPNFNIEYTFKTPLNDYLLETTHLSKTDGCKNPSQLSCGYGHYSCIKKSLAIGYERILILEDDIRFLKDIDNINRIVSDTPLDYDIVMYDNLADISHFEYEKYLDDGINESFSRFKHLHGGSCYSLNRNGMNVLARKFEENLCISDHFIYKLDETDGIKKCFSKERICIQVEFGDSVTRNTFGNNVIHKMYKNGNADYGKYFIEQEYSYGDILK